MQYNLQNEAAQSAWVGKQVLKSSLQNKIWDLPDQCTILPKFIYGQERKPVRPTPVLPVRVRRPAFILKTEKEWLYFASLHGVILDQH